MTRFSTRFSLILWFALASIAPGSSNSPQDKPGDPAGLQQALKAMDSAASSFRTTQAQFEWDRYEKVIDEVDDIQFGTIYYRRAGKEVEMKADITKPDRKFVLFGEGKIRMYLPKPDQVTVCDLGKNSSDFQSYLVLGFGGSGQELVKSFDVTYLGPETISGVATAKLQLVPKSERVRNTFKQILLWIDLERGISVQQQFFEPQGDYRLAKYSGIKINEKIPNDVFQIKTTSKTQTVSPKC